MRLLSNSICFFRYERRKFRVGTRHIFERITKRSNVTCLFGELENRRIKPWNTGETPCWITAEAWSCKITEFLHPEWKMAEFLLKRLKSKKCLQLDLCVSHTYITCLLQALPYHTAVKLVSNHSSSEWVLYYLNQFLYLQLSRLLETNSFQTLCRWMSSLLWGSHHVHYKSVSLPNCKILSSYTKMCNRMSSLLCESLQEYFHQRKVWEEL